MRGGKVQRRGSICLGNANVSIRDKKGKKYQIFINKWY